MIGLDLSIPAIALRQYLQVDPDVSDVRITAEGDDRITAEDDTRVTAGE